MCSLSQRSGYKNTEFESNSAFPDKDLIRVTEELLFADSSRRKRYPLPLVKVTIAGEQHRILIDTGSEISCVSLCFWESLANKDSFLILPAANTRIIGATQVRSKPIKHCVRLIFEHDAKKFSCFVFVVPNLNCKMLLGMDWIMQNNVIVDFPNCKLKCHDAEGQIISDMSLDTIDVAANSQHKANNFDVAGIQYGVSCCTDSKSQRQPNLQNCIISNQPTLHETVVWTNESLTDTVDPVGSLTPSCSSVSKSQRSGFGHVYLYFDGKTSIESPIFFRSCDGAVKSPVPTPSVFVNSEAFFDGLDHRHKICSSRHKESLPSSTSESGKINLKSRTSLVLAELENGFRHAGHYTVAGNGITYISYREENLVNVSKQWELRELFLDSWFLIKTFILLGMSKGWYAPSLMTPKEYSQSCKNSKILHNLSSSRQVYRMDIDFPIETSDLNSNVNINDIRNVVKNIATLTAEQKDQLINLLYENRDIFSDKPGLTNKYVHPIELNDQSPFLGKIYPVPFAYRAKVREQISKMLEWGIVERSNTCYINSLVPVLKKDGTVRICLDARELNKRVIVDYERVPIPEEILQRFESLTHLSTIDLVQSYWQVPLRPEDRKYTGFLFESKTYHFKVIPFGLSTAVAGFTRCMDIVLGPAVSSFTTAYVDDLLVTSDSFLSHCNNLQQIFNRIRAASMTLNFKKSCFCQSEAKFLGYILSCKGIRPDPKRIEAIQNFPIPKNLKKLQSFLGLCNFDRRFCDHYSDIAEPLTALLKKNRKWSWSEVENDAFERVKSAFSRLNQLTHPMLDKPFYVNTDSSNKALGAVLYQYNELDERCVLAYASRLLSPAERNYSATEREALALVWALQKWRVYLLGVPVKAITDHEALSFLSRSPTYNARILRWFLTLQDYQLTIQYLPGKLNTTADTLSRLDDENPNPVDGRKSHENLFAVNVSVKKVLSLPKDMTRKLKNISRYQDNDPCLASVKAKIKSNREEKFPYVLENGVLFELIRGVPKLCLPESLIDDVILAFHQTYGHAGISKCVALLKSSFAFPFMVKYTRNIISQCMLCLKSKFPNQYLHGPLTPIIPCSARDLVAVDIFGPLPRSIGGVRYVFVVLNVFTKYVKLFPLKKATSKVMLSRITKEYFPEVGKPRKILSDHGSQFTSATWLEGLNAEGVQVIYSSIRHPQSNPSERVMRELGRVLRAYSYERHSSWVKWLPIAEIWFNHNVHEATGCIPYELHFKKPSFRHMEELFPNIKQAPDRLELEDLDQLALGKMVDSASKRGKRHERKYPYSNLEPGDLVLLRTDPISSVLDKETRKLALLYKGPFRVKEVVAPNAYRLVGLEDDFDQGIHNIVNLRKVPN